MLAVGLKNSLLCQGSKFLFWCVYMFIFFFPRRDYEIASNIFFVVVTYWNKNMILTLVGGIAINTLIPKCDDGIFEFTSVQLLSRVWLLVIPWTVAHQASLSITNSCSLLKLTSIESVMPSNHLIFCLPFLLPPSIFPSIRVFSNESVLRIRWPKYWNFSISPSSDYSGLISFRMDWLDLLAVQETLKSLLQHHSSKPSILLYSAFFIVQL